MREHGIYDDFDGWIVINWEGAFPLFKTASEPTRDVALQYTRNRYPHLRNNYRRALDVTEQEYNYWYRKIMEPTLQRMRDRAPNAKFAIWSYPRADSATPEDLDAQKWLFDLLDAYTPAIYFGRDVVDDRRPRRPREETPAQRKAKINSRCAPWSDLTGEFDMPVIPYANLRYGPRTFRHGELVTEDEDLEHVWVYPYEEHDVRHFFVWEAVTDKAEADEVANHVINVLVPWLEQRYELVVPDSAAQGLLLKAE